MSAKSFILAGRSDKELSKLPIQIQRRVLRAFDIIKKNPVIGIKLHGELGDYYKFRIGDYRIVYSFNSINSTVSVVKIEHRLGVYR